MAAFWHTLARTVRHRWLSDPRDVRRALPAQAARRLMDAVTASERRHTGQIRICVEAGLPLSYLWRGAPARQRAVMLFGKLRVWDTEHNNGVLIYLLLAEHAIEIVADRALARAVPAAQWRAMVEHLSAALRADRYEEGLAQALQEVDAVLAANFPADPGAARHNELPDAVVML